MNITFGSFCKDNKRKAFTVVELLTVAAVLSTLAITLVMVIQSNSSSAQQAACVQNLRQIYVALQFYLADHNQRFPPNRANKAYQDDKNPAGLHHQQFFVPYLAGFVFPPNNHKEAGPFWCPGDRARKNRLPVHSYGINILHGLDDNVRATTITNPRSNIYLIDATRGTLSTCRLNDKAWPFTLGTNGRTPATEGDFEPRVDLRHEGKANALFLDGHVSSFPLEAFVGKSPSNLY